MPAPEIWEINTEWCQGVAPGYWPTATVSSLVLNIAKGFSFIGNVRFAYAGGTLTLTNNATNYVFLDKTNNNVPSFNTTGYPAAACLPIATVVTLSGAITSVVDDRTWFIEPFLISVAGITMDGGTLTPTTGPKGYLQVPFAATITGWTLLANVSGSAQIDVKKCSDAGFPTTTSIVAAAPPSISGAQKGESSTLTGWTTAIAVGDILEFNLDSVTTCKRLTLELKLLRT